MSYTILTNTELNPQILEMMGDDCTVIVWDGPETDPAILQQVDGFYVYGHPRIKGDLMDKMPNLRVISNFGVGVDHIHLEDARERGIAVGYTPRLV
ncbi:MAG: hypothetical protein HC802_17515, partial [Caldilineaceae bacterium]|nr:hypothetical protein [Caldilineaceae bacterium]